MEALESLCRAVGYGGWGAVLLGVLCVMMAVLLGAAGAAGLTALWSRRVFWELDPAGEGA